MAITNRNNSRYILSIDAGTSRIKTVIYDETGNEVYCVDSSSQVLSVDGRMEIDMNGLWQVVSRNIYAAITRGGIKRENIISVVFSAQGEGTWLLDEHGTPVDNAILWNDCRASHIVNEIKQKPDLYNEIKYITGSYPRSGSTIVLLKWYKKNRPEKYNKIKYCVSCKDWLRYKLTSELFCDLTDASTSCLNIHTKQYAVDILSKLGIAEAKSFFPDLRQSSCICGYVSKQGSEETSIPEGVCVAAGMLDIVATSVGAGAIKTGDVCTILGTSCINEITTDTFVFDESMTGWECHLVDDLFINVAGAMAGTPNLDWGLRNIMGIDKFEKQTIDDLEQNLKEIPVGANGLIYHPYISLSGERAPFMNPNATGQISGFNISTTKYELMRSIYEGVALSSRDCLEKLSGNGRLFLTGGGARSSFWAQMIADCVGREVILGEGEEFSAKGGAIAASIACGLYKTPSEAVDVFCRVREHLDPKEQNYKKYTEIYRMYKEMREQSGRFWNWRHDFLKN